MSVTAQVNQRCSIVCSHQHACQSQVPRDKGPLYTSRFSHISPRSISRTVHSIRLPSSNLFSLSTSRMCPVHPECSGELVKYCSSFCYCCKEPMKKLEKKPQLSVNVTEFLSLIMSLAVMDHIQPSPCELVCLCVCLCGRGESVLWGSALFSLTLRSIVWSGLLAVSAHFVNILLVWTRLSPWIQAVVVKTKQAALCAGMCHSVCGLSSHELWVMCRGFPLNVSHWEKSKFQRLRIVYRVQQWQSGCSVMAAKCKMCLCMLIDMSEVLQYFLLLIQSSSLFILNIHIYILDNLQQSKRWNASSKHKNDQLALNK